MLCIKVPIKDAEKAKNELMSRGLLDKEHYIKKDNEFVYFPVIKKFSTEHKLVNRLLKKKKVQKDLKESLDRKLKKKDLEKLRSSMDILGSIAILEIADELKKKEKLIAREVLKGNKNIKTVLRKGKHEGVFRVQKLKHLAGEKTKEALYKENGVMMKLDVEKVYFSPRLSSERKRIMQMVTKQEDVLVMFSGCGPYVCVIAKNTPAKSVYGVEINPTAHNYAIQNVLLNKLTNAFVFVGDVKIIVPKLKMKFDRIIMPLPKSASDYLDTAFKVSKPGTMIHFYDFQKEGEFERSVEKIKKACQAAKKECKILGTTKCGQSAPREFRVCVDFELF
jgi:tRNA (guanine37-N1)-methyltransferase